MLLATGSLTVLVSLKSQFAPDSLVALWVLRLALVSLALTIANAAFVLQQIHLELQDLFLIYLQRAALPPNLPQSTEPPDVARSLFARKAHATFPWLLCTSLAFLTAFALLNTDQRHGKAQDADQTNNQQKPASTIH